MWKRVAILVGISSLVWACSTSTAAEDAASSEGAATAGTTIDAVFAGVKQGAPKCFEKNYPADHMARHPKQTVTAIRIELSHGDENSSFEAANGAKVTFTQKTASGPHIRELSCDLVNGAVLCTEEPTCASSVVLAGTGTGLRMTNHDLRASGACDETPKPLDKAAGADDVFDLVAVDCHAGTLANPPTVDCTQALSTVRSCIDVMPEKCENMISKGTRYSDEFQMSAAEGKRLESAEECIQRFTDIVQEDGCCGG
jgi:hypothetical protein